jgi:hypothetical protein
MVSGFMLEGGCIAKCKSLHIMSKGDWLPVGLLVTRCCFGAPFWACAAQKSIENETSAVPHRANLPGYLGYYRNVTLSLKIHLNI